ncbi:MAG: TolC family protein [Sulfuricellaceae bacterium]|jgi:cobalt-zinc-cadmium efflux system outer membrane protein
MIKTFRAGTWFVATTIAAILLLCEPARADADLSHLSLTQAEELWLEHSREVRLARTAVEGAEADAVSAAQRPNPQLSINVSSLSRQPGLGTGGLRDKMMDTVIGLSQTFERGDKREHRTRSAQWRLDAAKQDYSDALRSQRMVLRQAYYDLVLAQEKSRIAEESAALYRKSMAAGELRLKAGDIAGAELARIRVEALRAENDARQAANDLARARLVLAYLLGKENSAAKIVAADGWPAVTAEPPATEVEIDHRPDVRAALNRVHAAEAARELARSLKTRDVNVGVQFEHNPTGSGYAANSYGVAVSVPLFLNYSYEGEIRRAEADLETAREQLDQVRAQAVADTEGARGDLDSAAKRARQYDDGLLAEAERAAKAAEFAYKNGAMGLMDLLDARRTYKATQIDAATARADYAKALAAWKAAVAGEGKTE